MRFGLASKIAFSVLLIGAIGVMGWWVRHRPSFLLYEAHDQLDQGNQSGVIAEYRRLLDRPNLPAAEEIKLRNALGDLYVTALQDSTDVDVLPTGPDYRTENPFVALAKKEFQRVLELDPTNSVAHDYMGRILWTQNLENYALEEFQKSRQSDPKDPEPLRYLAKIHLERGDAAAARDEALQALALSPSYDEARLVLVSCYSELGETSAALDEYERLSPAFRAGPDAQARYALLLMQANRWDQAAQLFAEAEEKGPKSGRLQIAYGRYLLARGRPRDASGAFAQAAALMPRSAWPLAWSVPTSTVNGDCDQAQRVSQILMEALPRWPWSHWSRAWSQLCRNDAEGALASLSEALRLSPDFSEALELKSALLLDMGRAEELGDLLRPLINHEHHRSFAYTKMAQSLLDQKKSGMALDVAETAVKFDPTNLDAFLTLGRARLNVGDRDGARRAFENAQNLDPDNPRVRAYVALTDRSGAELQQTLSALAREWSDGAEIWCLLGDVSERLGDAGQAAEAYQAAAAAETLSIESANEIGLMANETRRVD